MQLHFTQRTGSDKLIVFALGWAADHKIIEHIRPEGFDVACLYDYDTPETLRGSVTEEISAQHYPERHLFAWSFGVWAAEQLFHSEEFTRAVALNGTPLPVHDLYGIQQRRMAVTIRGLEAGGTDAFNRRAYGDSYEPLKEALSPRLLEANIAELRALDNAAQKPYTPGIRWDKAVVGEHDAIFPPENMMRYWRETTEIETEILPLPHYPFANGRIVTDELER